MHLKNTTIVLSILIMVCGITYSQISKEEYYSTTHTTYGISNPAPNQSIIDPSGKSSTSCSQIEVLSYGNIPNRFLFRVDKGLDNWTNFIYLPDPEKITIKFVWDYIPPLTINK